MSTVRSEMYLTDCLPWLRLSDHLSYKSIEIQAEMRNLDKNCIISIEFFTVCNFRANPEVLNELEILSRVVVKGVHLLDFLGSYRMYSRADWVG